MKYPFYFISGHRDLTQEEFDKYYKPAIDNALLKNKPLAEFIVGDYEGCDTMAQQYLYELTEKYAWFHYDQVCVYHMGDKPMNLMCEYFDTFGDFNSDEERDAQMTIDSYYDIAFVRPGKRDSGTAQNIIRRYEFNMLNSHD